MKNPNWGVPLNYYLKDGYWYIGGTNTGVPATGTRGPKGDKGDKGDKGAQGDVTRDEWVSINTALATRVNYLTPEMFGAVGDGINDDTNALQSAINYATDSKKSLKLSNKTYLTTSPLKLHDYIMVEGNYNNDEYSSGSIIKNVTTDMLEIEYKSSENKYKNIGVKITGICFIGDNTTKFINDDNLSYLYWSQIRNCGFRDFYSLMENFKLTGCWLTDIFFNKGIFVGSFGGSDNYFANWFVSANENTETRSLYMFNLSEMVYSYFSNMFLTGSLTVGKGCKKIFRLNISSNNVFDRIYFDYCDEHGLYIENASCYNHFINCSHRGLCRSTTSVYDWILIKSNSNYNKFTSGTFSTSHLPDETNISSRFYDIQSGVIGTIINDNSYGLSRAIFRAIQSTTEVNEIASNCYLNKRLNAELVALPIGNYQTYPQTIIGGSNYLATFAASNLETTQVLYRAYIDTAGNQLPDGLVVTKCKYDGTNIKITITNTTTSDIVLNQQIKYHVYVLS